jgi:thiol-disulfide isomerase/thioredoxin
MIGEIMKTLEAIEKDLRETREALSNTEGRDAEVYSRIVGYYRSVRNWNKGKREEFGERKMFASPVPADGEADRDSAASGNSFCESCSLPVNTNTEDDAGSRLVQIPAIHANSRTTFTETAGQHVSTDGNMVSEGLFQDADLSEATDCGAGTNPRIILFVRQGCPSCPDAKTEAGKLAKNFGVNVEMVNADSEAGLAEARKLGVTATPTAILLRGSAELSRANDRDEIAGMSRFFEPLKRSA